ncbi:MAG: hypothetical protein FWC57_03280 [Endomicrobia bacterium]|nr:hypothetical protein [Endomicrobiia bacterium]
MHIRLKNPERAAPNHYFRFYAILLAAPLLWCIVFFVLKLSAPAAFSSSSLNDIFSLFRAMRAAEPLLYWPILILYLSSLYFIPYFYMEKRKVDRTLAFKDLYFTETGALLKGKKEVFYPYMDSDFKFSVRVGEGMGSDGQTTTGITGVKLEFAKFDSQAEVWHLKGLPFAYKMIHMGKRFKSFSWEVIGSAIDTAAYRTNLNIYDKYNIKPYFLSDALGAALVIIVVAAGFGTWFTLNFKHTESGFLRILTAVVWAPLAIFVLIAVRDYMIFKQYKDL